MNIIDKLFWSESKAFRITFYALVLVSLATQPFFIANLSKVESNIALEGLRHSQALKVVSDYSLITMALIKKDKETLQLFGVADELQFKRYYGPNEHSAGLYNESIAYLKGNGYKYRVDRMQKTVDRIMLCNKVNGGLLLLFFMINFFANTFKKKVVKKSHPLEFDGGECGI